MKYFYFFTIYSLLPLKCCRSRPCLSSELHLWRVALGFFSLCLFHPVILLLGFGQREYYTCDWTIFASLGPCPSGSFPSSEGSAWWPELSAWVLSFDLQLSNGLDIRDCRAGDLWRKESSGLPWLSLGTWASYKLWQQPGHPKSWKGTQKTLALVALMFCLSSLCSSVWKLLGCMLERDQKDPFRQVEGVKQKF